jgi:hypothetical protein
MDNAKINDENMEPSAPSGSQSKKIRFELVSCKAQDEATMVLRKLLWSWFNKEKADDLNFELIINTEPPTRYRCHSNFLALESLIIRNQLRKDPKCRVFKLECKTDGYGRLGRDLLEFLHLGVLELEPKEALQVCRWLFDLEVTFRLIMSNRKSKLYVPEYNEDDLGIDADDSEDVEPNLVRFKLRSFDEQDEPRKKLGRILWTETMKNKRALNFTLKIKNINQPQSSITFPCNSNFLLMESKLNREDFLEALLAEEDVIRDYELRCKDQNHLKLGESLLYMLYRGTVKVSTQDAHELDNWLSELGVAYHRSPPILPRQLPIQRVQTGIFDENISIDPISIIPSPEEMDALLTMLDEITGQELNQNETLDATGIISESSADTALLDQRCDSEGSIHEKSNDEGTPSTDVQQEMDADDECYGDSPPHSGNVSDQTVSDLGIEREVKSASTNDSNGEQVILQLNPCPDKSNDEDVAIIDEFMPDKPNADDGNESDDQEDADLDDVVFDGLNVRFPSKNRQRKSKIAIVQRDNVLKCVKIRKPQTKIPCPACGFQVQKSNLKRHVQRHINKTKRCKNCGRMYAYLSHHKRYYCNGPHPDDPEPL